MKRLILVASVFLLAGCSAQTTATPTDTPSATPTVPVNTDACHEFREVIATIPAGLNSDENANDMWEGVRVAFDNVALTADGQVQERMLDLVNDWPDIFDIAVMNDFEEINRKFDAVDRACSAEGINANINGLTTAE